MSNIIEDKYSNLQAFFVPDRIIECKNNSFSKLKLKEEIKFVISHDDLYNDFISLIEEKKTPGDKNKTNSILAYVCGLTNKFPNLKEEFKFNIRYKLARVSPPDIDIDFEDRKPVFDYLKLKYGEDHTAFISTYVACKSKKSVQMAFKIKDIKMGDMDSNQTSIWFSKKVRNEENFYDSINQPGVIEYVDRYKEAFNLAEKIHGIITFISKHPAGILLTDKKIDEYIPLMARSNGESIASEYDKDDIENIGLLKYDLLKISTLGHIHKTVDMIKEKTGEVIDIESVKLNDPKVFKIYRDRDTSGVFQMEKYMMRKVLESVKVNSFEDIVACNALGRPGPVNERYPEEYGKRQKQPELIKYYHSSLEEVLKDTYGLILYQEQVTKISEILAGLTQSQSDKIRKFIGKKQTDDEKIKQIRDMFLKGCERTGKINQEFALRIWQIMEGFGAYAFNKSHSVAYSIISYWTAYLKTYYYVYFMSVLLSTTLNDGQEGFEVNIENYKKELRSRGYIILSPDINRSKDYFDVVDEKTIIEPFHVLKGIGIKVGTNISRVQPFDGFDDFLQKTSDFKIGSDVIETMLENGYFKSFGEKSNFMDQYHVFVQKRKRDRVGGKMFSHDPLTIKVPFPGKYGNKILNQKKYSQKDLF